MESKMLYCRRCKKYRGFYFKDGFWICVGCGLKIEDEKRNDK